MRGRSRRGQAAFARRSTLALNGQLRARTKDLLLVKEDGPSPKSRFSDCKPASGRALRSGIALKVANCRGFVG